MVGLLPRQRGDLGAHTYHLLRLDIEGGSSYWSTNVNNNQAFFEDMIDQANKMNQNVGVYTSSSQVRPHSAWENSWGKGWREHLLLQPIRSCCR